MDNKYLFGFSPMDGLLNRIVEQGACHPITMLSYLEANDAWKKCHPADAPMRRCIDSRPKVEVGSLCTYPAILLGAVHHLVEALLLSQHSFAHIFCQSWKLKTYETTLNNYYITHSEHMPYFPICCARTRVHVFFVFCPIWDVGWWCWKQLWGS